MKKTRSALPPLKTLSLALATCFAVNTHVLSATAVVTYGTASFQQVGDTLTIKNSNGAIINWPSFSIDAGKSVHFSQLSSTSSVYNWVVGSDPSKIYGSLSSNGRVYLFNPNGIFVGPGGRVDAAAFVASSLALSEQDFLAGRLNFKGGGKAGVVENRGLISTTEGGSVYLIGSQVINRGTIDAPKGEVVLAAGQSVQLVNTATPGVKIEFSASDESVQNLGTIAATGGQIGLAAALVKNAGNLNASSVSHEGGRIYLRASKQVEVDAAGRIIANGTKGGTIQLQSDDQTLIAGTLEATGDKDTGGKITALGNKVGLLDGALLDASGQTGGGTVLVGGDFQGRNPEVQNAAVTWFGQDAHLKANAVQAGDGGKIIVWADDTTRAYGAAEARGGATGGQGGLIEVSGQRYLDFQGLADTSAAHGKAGTLLLDPMDVEINDSVENFYGGAFYGSAPSIFSSATSTSFSQIRWSTIASQLALGDVIISTKSAGTGTGNISVTQSFGGGTSMTITHPEESGSFSRTYFNLLNSANSLTLLAENNVSVQSSFGNAGTGAINVTAGWDSASPATAATLGATGSISVGSAFQQVVVASRGNQTWRAPQAITISGSYGGGIDIDTGALQMDANQIFLTSPSGFSPPGFRQTFIAGNGNQTFNLTGSGSLMQLSAGNGFGAYGDSARITQHGATSGQTFNFHDGAHLALTAGSSSGGSNICYGGTIVCNDQSAEIRNLGSGGQSFNFFAPGSTVTLNGGNGGVGNSAEISNSLGAQTITWVGSSANAPSISLFGGYGGGFDSEVLNSHTNSAGISSDSTATQIVRANNIVIDARAGGAADVQYGGAYLAAANQNITANGSVELWGGASSVSDNDGGGPVFFDGGLAVIGYDTAANLTLNVGSDLTITSGGLAYGGAGIGSLGGDASINIATGGNFGMDAASAGGASAARVGAAAGTATITINANGGINLAGSSPAASTRIGSLTKTGTLAMTAYGSTGIDLGSFSLLRADSVALTANAGLSHSVQQGTAAAITANALTAAGNRDLSFSGTGNAVDKINLSSTLGSVSYDGGPTDVFAQTITAGTDVFIDVGRNITLGSISAPSGTVSISANNSILESDLGTTDITAATVTLNSAQGSLDGTTLAISADVDVTSGISAFASGAGYGGIRIRHNGSGAPSSIVLSDQANQGTGTTVSYVTSADLASVEGSLLMESSYGGDIALSTAGKIDNAGMFIGLIGTNLRDVSISAGGSVDLSSVSVFAKRNVELTAGGNISLNGSSLIGDSGTVKLTGHDMMINASGIQGRNGTTLIGRDITLDGGTGVVSANAGVSILGTSLTTKASSHIVSLKGIDVAVLKDVAMSDLSYMETGESSGPILADVKLIAGDNLLMTTGASIKATNDVFVRLGSSGSSLALSGNSYILSKADFVCGFSCGTTYVDFLQRSSGGILIDGVETTTTSEGGSGFYITNTATPAGPGGGLVISHGTGGGVNPVDSLLGKVFDDSTETQSDADVDRDDLKKMLKAKRAKQDDSNDEGKKNGSGKTKPAQCT